MKRFIEKTLGNCKFPKSCICSIKSSYESISAKIFYIYDEGGDSQNPAQIVTNDKTFQLTVNNREGKEIFLIKTDKCLIDNSLKKCDCIVSADQESYLVEIKTCRAGSRSKRRAIATEQLKATIALLFSNKIDLQNHKITALICFNSSEPRITQASRNSANAIFKLTYGVSLEVGNVINF